MPKFSSGGYRAFDFGEHVWQSVIFGRAVCNFSLSVHVDSNAGNSGRQAWRFGEHPVFASVDITALQRGHRVLMSEDFYPSGIPPSPSLSSSPSLHGGRGATPSEGGRPSDLSALAGGGRPTNFLLCAVPLRNAPGSAFS